MSDSSIRWEQDADGVVVLTLDDPTSSANTMNLKPRARKSRTSSITSSALRMRGFWPSVRHTEQNEQCLGQPRTVCTDAIM